MELEGAAAVEDGDGELGAGEETSSSRAGRPPAEESRPAGSGSHSGEAAEAAKVSILKFLAVSLKYPISVASLEILWAKNKA